MGKLSKSKVAATEAKNVSNKIKKSLSPNIECISKEEILKDAKMIPKSVANVSGKKGVVAKSPKVKTAKTQKRLQEKSPVTKMKKLKVEKSYKELSTDRGKGLYLNNIPFMLAARKVKNYFSACGEVEHCYFPREKGGKSKGYGYIYFKTEEKRNKVLEKSFHIIPGICRPILVEAIKSDDPSGQKKREDREKRTPKKPWRQTHVSKYENVIYVGALHYKTTEKKLKDHFSDYGSEVVNVTMPVMHGSVMEGPATKGKCFNRGFAFVAFADESALKNALEGVNKIDGKELRVQRTKCIKKDKEEQAEEEDGEDHCDEEDEEGGEEQSAGETEDMEDDDDEGSDGNDDEGSDDDDDEDMDE